MPKLYDKRRLLLYWAGVFVSYVWISTLPFLMFPNQHRNDDEFDFFQNKISKTAGQSNQNELRDLPPPPPNDLDFIPENGRDFTNQKSPSDMQGSEGRQVGPPPPMLRQNNFFVRNYVMGILPFLLSFFSSFFLHQSIKKKEMERAKAKADLLNLRYQLQPHFLFNTLNSIYSLILIKSDDASEGILKLSNVMRYIVEESENDFVLLSKELFYIKDYIALQLMRTDESLDFDYKENGVTNDVKIVPMILLNYIENAFKYGVNAEENSKISIEVNVKDETLNFKVFNNIVNHSAADESTKVGMKNTTERLEKLYPGKYTLNVEEISGTYSVELNLDLSA
ncbi:histidine kinase [Epilithonimonas ginsengisoli]|uniref:Histidine kinase n=1 Tax=Epilithonimonas ginsengisoli TaxID=1245592 RepID=A0ABU4JHX9_9FLAO|nr:MULTISPECIES: histidine kinase [Chryseobacterium group]MBV6880682.1 histidine kinase [Epilithonimonas sp. FP105]MDW8549227.1 histidine kinase [Epilithonimonas ginsengisoli]